jgi:thioredoxin-related protein
MRLIAALTLALTSVAAQAAELIIVERKGCVWCETFDREIAPGYANTDEGKRAPLRRQDLHKPWPEGLVLNDGTRLTPTFILVDGGREIGRFVGYPGAEFFYPTLAKLLQSLPEKPQ